MNPNVFDIHLHVNRETFMKIIVAFSESDDKILQDMAQVLFVKLNTEIYKEKLN